MGREVASLAQRGVVDSSRFNTATNDLQKNFCYLKCMNLCNNKTAAGLMICVW